MESRMNLCRLVYGSDGFDPEANYGRFGSKLYRYKAIICILLGLYLEEELDEDWYDKSCVVYFSAQRPVWSFDGSGVEWDEIRVGYGLLHNWWYYETEDSSI